MADTETSKPALGGSLGNVTGKEVLVDLTSANATLTVATHGKKTLHTYAPVPGRSITLPDATGFLSVTNAVIGGFHEGEDIALYNAGTVNTDQVLEAIIGPGPWRAYSLSIGSAKGTWVVIGNIRRKLWAKATATKGQLSIGTNGFTTNGAASSVRWLTASSFFTTWCESSTVDIEGNICTIDTSHVITVGALTSISATANTLGYPRPFTVLGGNQIGALWWDSTATATARGVGGTVSGTTITLGSAINFNSGITDVLSIASFNNWSEVVEDYAQGGNFWFSGSNGTNAVVCTLNLTTSTLTALDSDILEGGTSAVPSTTAYSPASGKLITVNEVAGNLGSLAYYDASSWTGQPTLDWEEGFATGGLSSPAFAMVDKANSKCLSCYSTNGYQHALTFDASGITSASYLGTGGEKDLVSNNPAHYGRTQRYLSDGFLLHYDPLGTYAVRKVSELPIQDYTASTPYRNYFYPEMIPAFRALYSSWNANYPAGADVHPTTKNVVFCWAEGPRETGDNYRVGWCVMETPRNMG